MEDFMSVYSKVFTATPTLDTSAYIAGDRLGSIVEIENFFQHYAGKARLISVVALDQAKQKAAFDIYFFNASPTVASADNAPLDITDAEMTAKCIGRVSVATGDYGTDLAANSEATKYGLDLMLQAGADSKSLFILLRSAGTPTYAATSLTLKLGVLQG
jgi:hypothetical protein